MDAIIRMKTGWCQLKKSGMSHHGTQEIRQAECRHNQRSRQGTPLKRLASYAARVPTN